MGVNITYIYHSCFVVENDEIMLVYDYWKDTPDQQLHHLLDTTDKQVYFIVSHFHEDHYNPEVIEWYAKNPSEKEHRQPRLLLSYDTVKRRRVNKQLPTCIMRFDEFYEDEFLKVTFYHSTDVGVSTVTELADGTTLYHAGDNNNWYFADNNDQVKVSNEEMEGIFLAVARDIRKRYSAIDYVFFPVDPRLEGQMLRGPQQWLFNVESHHFYPMHYWDDATSVEQGLAILEEMFPRTTFHYPPHSDQQTASQFLNSCTTLSPTNN